MKGSTAVVGCSACQIKQHKCFLDRKSLPRKHSSSNKAEAKTEPCQATELLHCRHSLEAHDTQESLLFFHKSRSCVCATHRCDLRRPTTTHLAACTVSCTRRLHDWGRVAAARELLHCSELVAMPLLLLFTAAAAARQCSSCSVLVSKMCPVSLVLQEFRRVCGYTAFPFAQMTSQAGLVRSPALIAITARIAAHT